MNSERNRRRGLTLIEAVVSLVIISVLMLGLSSSVMLGVRALPDDTELGAADREVLEILNTFRDDISNASQILNQVSGNNTRLVLTMKSTGAVGEATSITYDFLVDANMIRRRTDANAYQILTTQLDDCGLTYESESSEVKYLRAWFQFDHTIQGEFEVFVLTPYKPGLS